MAWVYLVIAGLFEIVWAIALKYADGFTKLRPSAIAVVGMILSVVLLELSLRTLPVGTAYAVWTGIGTVGAAILGMILFQEPATAVRIGCIGLIICGIAGLTLFACGRKSALCCWADTPAATFSRRSRKFMEPYGISRKPMRTRGSWVLAQPSHRQASGQCGLLKGKPCSFVCAKSPRSSRSLSLCLWPSTSRFSAICP